MRKKEALACGFACLVFVLQCTAPALANEFANILSGSNALKAGNYEKAIARYTEVLSVDPNNRFTLNDRGWAYYKVKDYQKAISDFDRAIALKPSFRPLYNRAVAYYQLGDYSRAVSDYDRAIALKRDEDDTYVDRGNSYREMGKYELALADYAHCMALKPSNARAYAARAVADARMGNKAKCDEDLARFIALDAKASYLPWVRQEIAKALPAAVAPQEVAASVKSPSQEVVASAKSPPLVATVTPKNPSADDIAAEVVRMLKDGATNKQAADTNDKERKPVNRPVGDKWALVIGVSEFKDKQIPGLRYSAKDAIDFRNFLVKDCKFSADHVRLLLNHTATERRVMSELGSKFLARLAQPDDLVVVFISSHGSPSQMDERAKNYVVAYDTDSTDLFPTAIEMQRILDVLKERVQSDRVLLVLDACHSGAAVPGSKGLINIGNFDAEMLAQGCGQLVICSSAPDQKSWESQRYPNGIFTRKLIEGLRMNGEQTKLGEAFGYVQSATKIESKEAFNVSQTPVLKSRWDGNDLILAVPAMAPHSIPPEVKAILEPDCTGQAVSPAPASQPGTAAKPILKVNSKPKPN